MRRIGRVDDNQPEIVAALRRAGASVAMMHMIGHGLPDILVGFRGVNYVFEIKDASKPLSCRKLTDEEREWHLMWRGQVAVIETAEQAMQIMGLLE